MSYDWYNSYPDDVDYHSVIKTGLVQEFLIETVDAFPQNNFIIYSGKIYSYLDAQNIIDRLASGLQHIGLKRGSKIGLMLSNSPEYIFLFFAILKTGATIVNIDYRTHHTEIERLVVDSEIEYIIINDIRPTLTNVRSIVEKTSIDKIIVVPFNNFMKKVSGILYKILYSSKFEKITKNDPFIMSYKELLKEPQSFVEPEIEVNDIALIQYTSGATGRAKGVQLTHGNLTSEVHMIFRLATPIRLNGTEISIAVMPFTSIFGLVSGLLMQVYAGSIIVIPFGNFEISDVTELINRYKVSLLIGFSSIYDKLAKLPHVRSHLKSLKYCISTGEALRPETMQSFERITLQHLVEGYGLTETSSFSILYPVTATYKEGSVGLPLPGCEVQILDIETHDQFLPPNEYGEICINGPHVMKGYFHDPEATKRVLYNGYIRTGDLGYMDEEGYIFILDREKNIINIKGYNVCPWKIKGVILTHHAVSEVLVKGELNVDMQYYVKAYIVVKGDATIDKDELLNFLSNKLTTIELPAEIEFLESLSKTLDWKN